MASESKVVTCCPETDYVCFIEKIFKNHQIVCLIWFFDSMLYTIGFLQTVLSFLIWVAEVPRKNYLLPAGLFFPDSATFCFFSVLQTLSLLFLCKNFLAILRNSSPCGKYLFPAEANYFIKGTNLSNQLMMSFVWREFSSVRRKMMKEDSWVPGA